MNFQPFATQKYLNLETFKKSGEGIRTPIWFAADPVNDLSNADAKLYCYTVGNSGKVKRIRNNGRVRIAPCDMRGKVTGEWIEARAELVGGTQFRYGMSLLDKKYFPWKQVLDFFASFVRREHAMIAISRG
jgi:uncharacterized protein